MAMGCHHADALQWFVVHTRPRQEDRADRNLRAWGVSTFAPKLCRRRVKSGTPRVTVEPLFPRYIFARFPLAGLLHQVRFTRGVADVVAFGDRPVPVGEDVIALIQSRMGPDGFAIVERTFQRGDLVVIEDGPLKDLVGVFDSTVNASHRVRILLTTVGCRARLEIDGDLLERCGAVTLS